LDKNLTETEELGQKIYGERYLYLRFEDLLENPFDQLIHMWRFLGGENKYSRSRRGGLLLK
jgi:hypothetical protein